MATDTSPLIFSHLVRFLMSPNRKNIQIFFQIIQKQERKGKRNYEYDLISMATRFNISLSFRKKLIFLRKKAQTGPF